MAKPDEDYTKAQLREEKRRLLEERRDLLTRNSELKSENDDAKSILKLALDYVSTEFIDSASVRYIIIDFLSRGDK